MRQFASHVVSPRHLPLCGGDVQSICPSEILLQVPEGASLQKQLKGSAYLSDVHDAAYTIGFMQDVFSMCSVSS